MADRVHTIGWAVLKTLTAADDGLQVGFGKHDADMTCERTTSWVEKFVVPHGIPVVRIHRLEHMAFEMSPINPRHAFDEMCHIRG